MIFRGFNERSMGMVGLLAALGLVVVASVANAEPDAFVFSGKPIHPACVHVLAMEKGDKLPVATSVSLQGCMASPRAKAETSYKDRILMFSDDAVLGGGSFGYRKLSTLDNGLEVIGILRIFPDGTEKVSVAAVDVVARPAIFDKQVVQRMQLEMIGEVWIKDMELASLRTAGNIVHFQAGVGGSRVEQTVDLSSIGKARKRKK